MGTKIILVHRFFKVYVARAPGRKFSVGIAMSSGSIYMQCHRSNGLLRHVSKFLSTMRIKGRVYFDLHSNKSTRESLRPWNCVPQDFTTSGSRSCAHRKPIKRTLYRETTCISLTHAPALGSNKARKLPHRHTIVSKMTLCMSGGKLPKQEIEEVQGVIVMG